MITVLFVAAALTVVSSTAAFVTIQEFRAGSDDRKAAEALSYAEAGIDRMLLEMRRARWTWGHIRLAGCDATHPALVHSGTVGSKGKYVATLTTYDSAPGLASSQRVPPSAGACTGRSSNPRVPQLFAVTSVGTHPAAKRVVRQVIRIQGSTLPIGVYANSVDATGNGGMLRISLVTKGDLTGREKIGFSGMDPYYVLNDFYPGKGSAPMPAAAHALGTISCIANCSTGPNKKIEHPPSPNCNANPDGDTGQSLWDGDKNGTTVSSGCAGQSGFPPTAFFGAADLQRTTPQPNLTEQDYMNLRESAKTSGIYCYVDSCTFGGVGRTKPSVIQPGDVAGLPNTYVAYFDFPAGGSVTSAARTIKWKAEVAPCNDDPNLNKSLVLIVRNGSLSMQNGAFINGAVLVPEGTLDSEGGYDIHGTIIADKFIVRGNAEFSLSECWINNMPAPLLDITPTRWSEIDR